MYRVRFHGRGGQGMKTASRILGTACFLAGFEVQDAPRYGAERRGAPIHAYVRADRQPIRERGIIRNPDLAIVADPTLVPIPAAGVLSGLEAHTLLLINSREPAEIWKDRLNLPGTVIAFHAGDADPGPAGTHLAGTLCAASAARSLGFVALSHLEQAIEEELAGLGPSAVAANLLPARTAYDRLAHAEGLVREGAGACADAYRMPEWIELPFDEARISAPVIHAALTSEAVPTGLWRTLRPVIDPKRCNRCWWVCSSFCPDGAISVRQGRPEIDYAHCKGCLVCLAQCPPHAIEALPETRTGEAAP